MAIVYEDTVECPICCEWVDSLSDGACYMCHVHSISDWPPEECGCSECEENEKESK